MAGVVAVSGTASVLVLNAGSSALRASLVRGGETLARAKREWGSDAAGDVREAIASLGATRIDAVGHRVVHGGARFTAPTLVDDAVLRAFGELRALAPLHLPLAVRTIAAARAVLPDVPHVAAFDTAFHRALPPESYVYPLPYAWFEDWGIRRFGFHGLSVEWSLERAATLLGRAASDLGLIVAHLGSGCSVTAVWEGRSLETTMGMTPLEGLMMGTRAGSVDPGVLLAVLRDRGLDLERLDDTLEHRSGLLGVSGRSADMRELLAVAPADERASLALAMFARRAAAGIAAVATALPRLDALAFTGGIGENAQTVRGAIVARLAALGVAPVAATDVRDDAVLSAPGARVAVLRIEAREDVVIARQVARTLATARAG